ncbi:WD repeat-containing protein 49-like [Coregonus clupeaformis]|uniref:WD repeat-containing protein 49-like n=1 Tax=Coregonus clupeaformis TaxID=59861 RepID=UPI001E1C308B|nr:WD repeat-containing protein 49-like [Coregonus clupeaformis]
MPLGKKVRPSSAAGKLEIQNVSSILAELGSAGERGTKTSGPEQRGERLAPGVARVYLGALSEDRPPPKWLERELLRQENRRHSVTLGDQVKLRSRLLYSDDPTRSFSKLKDEFCTYMQLEYTEKEESAWRSKQVAFSLPATVRALCHGEPVLRIHSTPDGTIVTVCEDGAVYYWSPELNLKRSKSVFVCCVLPSTNIEQQMREIREVCRDGKARRALSNNNGSPQPRAPCDQTVFPVYKGVMTFDLSKQHNLLVTGGMDRVLRLWNPYVPGKPTGVLNGHSAPIFYLFISSEENRIFSVSMDNTAKIWDIQDQSCLITAHPKASLIRGDTSACLYSPSTKALYIAADSLALLSLRTRPQPQGHLIVSHKEPVLCCGYSHEFRQVVSCTEGSVVKVWDFDTGSQVFEFGGAHGQSAITCMTFDPKGRRLVTGGRDGFLKIWNFNNGQCLKILKKDGESNEVCDCTYLTVHRNTYVMSVGWDRRIDIYSDSPDEPHHIQKPQPSWQDDLRRGHIEDILCVAQCPPSLLATSSYDGEVIVWNLVSGHIQCRFASRLQPDCCHAQGQITLSTLSGSPACHRV